MKRMGYMMMAVLALFMLGSSATSAQAAEVITETVTITWYDTQVEAVKTADNAVVLFNTAKTMGRPLNQSGMTHLEAAKAILRERNKTMPSNLSYNAGLYTFAPTSTLYTKVLKPYYPMQAYDKAAFAKAIEQLPGEAHGTTEIERALLSLEPVLKDLSGKTILFVFTDGVNTELGAPSDLLGPNEFARTPRELAQELAEKYDICFHIISSASGELEKRLLDAVASINECSRVLPIEDLMGKPEYLPGSLFVLDEKMIEVIRKQQKVVGFKMDNILFDFNKAAIKPEFHDALGALGKFLQEHPLAHVVLAGFTDPIGSSEYNMQLSRRRVESVSNYLMSNFKIGPGQIVGLWYGDLAPVAPNDTEAGRSKNRRVVGVVAGL
jgi:OOP family OmpA-OmpF porin